MAGTFADTSVQGANLACLKLQDVEAVDIHYRSEELAVCTDLQKMFCRVANCSVVCSFLFLHNMLQRTLFAAVCD